MDIWNYFCSFVPSRWICTYFLVVYHGNLAMLLLSINLLISTFVLLDPHPSFAVNEALLPRGNEVMQLDISDCESDILAQVDI